MAVATRPLPGVLVLDAEAGLDPAEQLTVLDAPALKALTVLLTIDTPDAELLGRLAAAGVFCGLPRAAGQADRDRVLQLALDHARVRRAPSPHGPTLAACQGLVTRARFELRSLQEAEAVAEGVAALCPDPGRRVGGLLELLVNAVEHGNLEISGPRKRALLSEGTWHTEVAARLADPRYADRTVRVDFERAPDRTVTVCIEDQGAGFDWAEVLARELGRNDTRHGRGIALARLMSFDGLTFEGPGNRAVARIVP
jgi:hypothetical protein